LTPLPAKYGLALGWAVLVLLLAAFTLTRGYNHDEEQFLAAARLSMDHAIYRDFIHLQPPYYVELLGTIYRVLGLQSSFFLTARLVNLLSTVVACLALWHRAGRNPWPGFAAIALFVTCTAIQPGIDSTRNDMMPCAVALWGASLVMDALIRPYARSQGIFLAGALFVVAVGIKLSYAFAPLAATIYLAWHRPRLLVPLMAGGVAGALPLLFYIPGSWEGFKAGVFEYHRVTPALWHAEMGLSHYFGLEYLAEFLNRRVLTDATLAILLLLATCLMTICRQPDVAARMRAQHVGLLLFLLAGALIFGLLPRPPYIQYFHPFAAFAIFCLPACWHALAGSDPLRKALLSAVLLLGCLPGGLVMLATVPKLLTPQKWIVSRVAETGQAVRIMLDARSVVGPVATLSPIPVLEAGLTIYPELSAGPFFYRTGDRLSVEAINKLKGTSRQTVPELLTARPPAAILVGRESGPLDAPFIDYARSHGYQATALPGVKGFTLWLPASTIDNMVEPLSQ
jgi:hypothetical protein